MKYFIYIFFLYLGLVSFRNDTRNFSSEIWQLRQLTEQIDSVLFDSLVDDFSKSFYNANTLAEQQMCLLEYGSKFYDGIEVEELGKLKFTMLLFDHKKHGFDKKVVESYAIQMGKIDKVLAVNAYSELIDVISVSADHDGLSSAYLKRGHLYLYSDSVQLAINDFNSVIKIESSKNTIHKLEAYRLNSIAHYYQGDFAKSSELIDKAIDIAHQIKEFGKIALLYNFKGMLLATFEHQDEAREVLYEALYYDSIAPNKNTRAYILNNLAGVYYQDGDDSIALRYYQQANILQPNDDYMMNTSICYSNMGLADSALVVLYDILDRKIEQNKLIDIATLLNNISIIHGELSRVDSSLYYFKELINRSSFDYSRDLILGAYASISEIEASLENYERAYYYQKRYKEISDSLNIIDREKEFEKIKLLNDLEKQNSVLDNQTQELIKVKQSRKRSLIIIATLVVLLVLILVLFITKRQLGRESQKIKEELYNRNRFLSKLFSMLSHDFRGSISVLNHYIDVKDDSQYSLETKQKMRQGAIVEIRKSLQQLDNLSILRRHHEDRLLVSIKQVQLQHIYKEVQTQYFYRLQLKNIQLVCDPLPMIVHADYQMLKLILCNLVSNAIMSSEPGKQIFVKSKLNVDHILIEVRDFGSGLKSELTDDLLFQMNMNLQQSKQGLVNDGLGLKVCWLCLHKMGGSILIDRNVSAGARFTLTLPLSDKVNPIKKEV